MTLNVTSDGRSPYRRLVLGFLLLLLGAFTTTGFLLWKGSYPVRLPSFDEVHQRYRQTDALLVDRHGDILHRLRIDPHGRRLDWTPLEGISPALVTAVIHSEDRRFFKHHGVDWQALSGVGYRGLWAGNWRGASTLTMQLVSQLDPRLSPHLGRRTLPQKVGQVRTALDLEKKWNKAEILEAYLNLVTFRGELQGVSAASTGLFGKQPHGLTPLESVILAALIRSPNAAPSEVSKRGIVLARSLDWGINSGAVEDKVREGLWKPYQVPLDAAWAPHLARQLLKQRSDHKDPQLRVACTLDGDLQRFVHESLRQHLMEVRSRNVNDGAVLVVDNPTGEVLAYVGSAGDLSNASQVDGIQSPRQAGSILKPFLYGLAFERRLMTPSSLLEDAPLEMGLSNGIYRPENYDRQFRGLVTARTALASSLNIPAVRTLNLVGVGPFVDELTALEFRDLKSADYYGPSLALGAVDITLWDLVNGYRTIANAGIWQPLRVTPKMDHPTCLGTIGQKSRTSLLDASARSGQNQLRKVLSPETAFILADILSDRESRSRTFSLESPLATRFWTAVKTGTSKDMRDNWCVGFSSRYTVGVWVGNFSGEPMWNVIGITGAAPVWVDIMNWLHRQAPSLAPAPPKALRAYRTGLPDLGVSRSEWYLPGTEMAIAQSASVGVPAKIVSPSGGEVVAWDPDIPADQQRVFLEARPKSGQLFWEMDGERVNDAGTIQMWAPQPGRHTLKLLSPSGETLDEVQFVVRGLRGQPN